VSEFQAKRDEALRLLARTGMWKSNDCPPLLRLLWKFGLAVPPPHFAGFTVTAVVAGGFFALAWGAIMWLLSWGGASFNASAMAFNAAVAGTVFGVGMAAYYGHGRRTHSLPAWSSLSTSRGA
jgi:hypothetical protein